MKNTECFDYLLKHHIMGYFEKNLEDTENLKREKSERPFLKSFIVALTEISHKMKLSTSYKIKNFMNCESLVRNLEKNNQIFPGHYFQRCLEKLGEIQSMAQFRLCNVEIAVKNLMAKYLILGRISL